ncbi:MAG: AI-2E family transporter [Bacteroidetes bacterium]|nr:AI-2E family transporter [Bacteroidota bacterium]
MDSVKVDKLTKVLKYTELIFFTAVILYFGKPLFIPAFFGLFIAIISYPVCKWLEVRGWPRSVSIGLVIAIFISVFFTLIWLLLMQADVFIQEIPLAVAKLKNNLPALQEWMYRKFGLQVSVQDQWLNELSTKTQSELMSMLRSSLSATISTVFGLILMPIYAALLLYHRETLVEYLEFVLGKRYNIELHTILQQITYTYFHFVRGTFFVYIIVGTLNSAGLYLLGIENAILYGMLVAFMTIIPYVGIIISSLLPISIALITKDSIWYSVGIVLVFSFVQYLEANVIFPRVVGAQLKVSTLAMMVAIILGTILWGVAGMILFIPFVAIMKIISDHIDDWKPLNILLSRSEPQK